MTYIMKPYILYGRHAMYPSFQFIENYPSFCNNFTACKHDKQ